MLRSVPIIFAGDFNVKLESSSAINRARWIDTCKLCASSKGVPEPDPTCFVRSTSKGSRIDALFSNGAARSWMPLPAPCYEKVVRVLWSSICSRYQKLSKPTPLRHSSVGGGGSKMEFRNSLWIICVTCWKPCYLLCLDDIGRSVQVPSSIYFKYPSVSHESLILAHGSTRVPRWC